jgi:hypothetical protein
MVTSIYLNTFKLLNCSNIPHIGQPCPHSDHQQPLRKTSEFMQLEGESRFYPYPHRPLFASSLF